MATIELVRRVAHRTRWHRPAETCENGWAACSAHGEGEWACEWTTVSSADIAGGFVPNLCAKCFPGGEG